MKKKILIFGFIYALVSLFTSLYYLYFNPSNLTAFLHEVGGTLLVSIIAAYFYRKQKDGIPSFRNIFLLTVGALSLGLILSTIITVIYFGTLSEEAKLLIENNFLEHQMSDLESITNINTIQDRIEKEADGLFSLSRRIVGIPLGIVFNSFIAAVVALFMKKEVNTELV